MSKLQKWGGTAALFEALAYIIGFVGFIAVVNIGGIADPLDKVAAIVAMAAAFALSLWLGVAPLVLGIQATVLCVMGLWIATRPSAPAQ